MYALMVFPPPPLFKSRSLAKFSFEETGRFTDPNPCSRRCNACRLFGGPFQIEDLAGSYTVECDTRVAGFFVFRGGNLSTVGRESSTNRYES